MRTPRRTLDSPDDERDGADGVQRFAAKHGISRSLVYEEIAAGRLIARKVASRTIITHEDGAAWRSALPKISPKDAEAKTPDSRGSVKSKHEKSSDRRKPIGSLVAPRRAQSSIRANKQQISEKVNNKQTNGENGEKTEHIETRLKRFSSPEPMS